MRLSELREGETAVIVKVVGHGGFRKRIIEMGFIKGKTVTAVMNAPLHDPIKYRLMGYEVSLRRQEADMIEIISREEALERQVAPVSHGSLNEEHRFTEEELKRLALNRRRTINVALVGNPNCGKTSLFNLASGAHEHVGNYSGVTVDAKEGYFTFQGYNFRIVDLPGTYSLSAYTPEEIYVRNHIIDQTPDIVINVVDASNIERNLYLTTQLIDMNIRMVVALNMFDELENSGNHLDYKQLSKLFGVPMLPTVCKKGLGIDHLFHIIINMYEGADFFDKNGNIAPDILKELNDWHKTEVHDQQSADYAEHVAHEQYDIERTYRHIHINHGQVIEAAIDAVKAEIVKNADIRHKYSTRFLAIKLLENDKEIEQVLAALPNGKAILQQGERSRKDIQATLNEDSESAITDAKYGFIAGALRETYVESKQHKKTHTSSIDAITMHRFWGYPIFLLLMFLMFEATFILGEYPMGWIESLVSWIGSLVQANMPDGMLKDLMVDGIIGGVGGVIVFLPNILILYFCISLMEDSGYMARAAFLMDKIMHKMGLHGKSFIPLIMSFGCNVPAVMATRTLESRKSRLITMLVIPLITCSARLPVFLLLTSAFFPRNGAYILMGIYLLSILTAVLAARLFSKFLVKEDDAPFVMELPPYRMPTAKSIFSHTWERGRQYLKKMGGIILIASIIIWFLGYFPRGEAGQTLAQQQEQSYIGRIGQIIEPALQPLGFDWQMGVGLLSGIGAKELIVSTLNVLYADGNEVTASSLPARMGITPLAAISYILFILFYFPCIATIVAIKQESGSWRWALFAIVYTVLLAWVASFAVYQIGSLFI